MLIIIITLHVWGTCFPATVMWKISCAPWVKKEWNTWLIIMQEKEWVRWEISVVVCHRWGDTAIWMVLIFYLFMIATEVKGMEPERYQLCSVRNNMAHNLEWDLPLLKHRTQEHCTMCITEWLYKWAMMCHMFHCIEELENLEKLWQYSMQFQGFHASFLIRHTVLKQNFYLYVCINSITSLAYSITISLYAVHSQCRNLRKVGITKSQKCWWVCNHVDQEYTDASFLMIRTLILEIMLIYILWYSELDHTLPVMMII